MSQPAAPARPGINPEEIENRMRHAWMEIGASAEQQGLPPPTRTHVMNLVTISLGAADAAQARTVFEHLAQALPSRIIHITLDDTEGMSATASAYCPIVNHHKGGCYEIINIHAGRQDMAAIPSVINRLTISDIETCIWWSSPVDFSSPAFQRISAAGDRVIVDTMAHPDPAATLAGFSEFLKQSDGGIDGSDLAWGRIITIRELVAQSFDIDAARAIIPEIRRIEIAYSAGWTAAAMLAGCWMSARLGLRPSGATAVGDSIVLSALDPGGATIQIRLQASSDEYGLQSVRMVAHSATRSSRVTIRKLDRERAIVNVDLTGQPRQERIVNCLNCNEVQLLGEELAQYSGDRMYVEALDQAATFAGFLLSERDSS